MMSMRNRKSHLTQPEASLNELALVAVERAISVDHIVIVIHEQPPSLLDRLHPDAVAGILVLLVGASVAGLRAAWPAQPSAEPPVQPTTVRVPPVAWKTDGWQKAPDGDGEYLLIPSPHASFEIGDRLYVATRFGVLVQDPLPAGAAASRTEPGPWKIVPELYRKKFQPLEVKGDLLWVVEAKPRGRR